MLRDHFIPSLSLSQRIKNLFECLHFFIHNSTSYLNFNSQHGLQCCCVLVPMDLDVRMKAVLLGASFLIVSQRQMRKIVIISRYNSLTAISIPVAFPSQTYIKQGSVCLRRRSFQRDIVRRHFSGGGAFVLVMSPRCG